MKPGTNEEIPPTATVMTDHYFNEECIEIDSHFYGVIFTTTVQLMMTSSHQTMRLRMSLKKTNLLTCILREFNESRKSKLLTMRT